MDNLNELVFKFLKFETGFYVAIDEEAETFLAKFMLMEL